MTYAVIDLETSIYESFGRKANPYDSRNYIVANGLKYQDGRKLVLHKLRDESLFPAGWLNGVTCLVGQNIKFDMAYLWGRDDVQAWLKSGGRIYDTMYAEYLMTGQHQRFENGQAEGLDLNSLALKYGGTTKPDIIKEYWQQGIQTIDIDQNELLSYLEGDIDNTEIVFLGQIKKYVPMGMTNTIKAHMEGLLATIEMECNGLAIDQDVGEVHRQELVKQIAELTTELDKNIPADLPPELTWNWNSGTHISALFFGGRLKFARRVQKTNDDGSFQFTKAKESCYVCNDETFITEAEFEQLTDTSHLKVYSGGKKVGQFVKRNVDVQGEPKYHTVDMWHTLQGTVIPRAEWETKKEGVYQTDSKVKTILASEGHPLAKLIHNLGKLTKLLGFYRYTDKDGGERGLLTMIQEDGFIHHRLNTTTTVTGRLSSSDPNMQQCFDGETEILTSEGFIPFPQYCGGMSDIPPCAQFNMRTGAVTWVYPKKLLHYDYTGKMVRYESAHTSMYVTEDHRCVVSVKSGGWGFLKAKYLNHPRGWQYSHMYVSAGQGTVIGETVNKHSLHQYVQVEDYPVYCVQVPERAIVVRRNGKVFVSGNCPRSDTGKVREMFVSRFGEDGAVGEIDFCLHPDTKVLTHEFVYKAIKDLQVGEDLVAFDEKLLPMGNTQFRKGTVTHKKILKRPCKKIVFSNGKEVISSIDHMWVARQRCNNTTSRRGNNAWIKTEDLKIGNHIPQVVDVWEDLSQTPDGAYMGGFLDGEGWISHASTFGVGQNRDEDHDVVWDKFEPILKRDFGDLRYSPSKSSKVVRVQPAGLRTAWKAVGMYQSVRLKKKLQETYEGTIIRSKRNISLEIVDIVDIGIMDVIAIQTTTKTFIAEGLLSHNCQLEVHGQAYLSGDENMIRDVTNKVDFHCMRVAAKLKEDYEYVKVRCKDEDHPEHKQYKTLRTGAKSFSFQRAYGASVNTIAADTGMTVADVQALADSEDILYPGVGEYNTQNIAQVTHSANTSGEYVSMFEPDRCITVKYGIGYLISPTGKRYSFVQQDAPEWMKERQKKQDERNAKRGFRPMARDMKTIAPQTVKNYPIQGFCGELMMNVCGVLFREFLARNRWNNKAFLVNTVHDCVWVDAHKSVAHEVALKVKEIMEQAAQIMEKRYGIIVNVPFYAEAEIGKNFYQMEGVH